MIRINLHTLMGGNLSHHGEMLRLICLILTTNLWNRNTKMMMQVILISIGLFTSISKSYKNDLKTWKYVLFLNVMSERI